LKGGHTIILNAFDFFKLVCTATLADKKNIIVISVQKALCKLNWRDKTLSERFKISVADP
jgi:hypothetical protein